MSWKEFITNEAKEKLTTKWSTRDGNVIPESESVVLKDGAVKVEATFLYADLAGSSKLAQVCPWQTTAKIIRAYLDICVRSIKVHEGEIRSFDGDRVMGVFMGGMKNTNAVQCAREIDWAVENVLRPEITKEFESIRKNNIFLKHCIGIDTGEAIAVRAGIRDDNDLIWIGRAPSLAAKLSDIRDHPYEVYITKKVYDKIGGSKMTGIWEIEAKTIADVIEILYKTKTTVVP